LQEHWHKKLVNHPKGKADPEEAAQYLAALCYSKRSKVDPFYFESVIAGVKDGHKTLTYVDLYGNKFTDKYITTGFARIIAPTIIDSVYHEEIPAIQAKELVTECFKAIFARFKLTVRSLTFVLVTEHEIFDDKVDLHIRFDYDGYKNKEDLF